MIDSDKDQRSRCEAIMRIPESMFEREIGKVTLDSHELTTAGMLRLAKRLQKEERRQAKVEAKAADLGAGLQTDSPTDAVIIGLLVGFLAAVFLADWLREIPSGNVLIIASCDNSGTPAE